MGKLTPDQFVRAMSLVSTTRIQDQDYDGWDLSWDEDQLKEACALYSAIEGDGWRNLATETGFEREVFNWLLDQVFADVKVGTLDPKAVVTIHAANG